MADPRFEKWAKALTGYSVDVQQGQAVAINGGAAAEPLLQEIHREVVERGAHPVMVPSVRGGASTLLTLGSDKQLEYVSPVERFVREEADIVINVMAETNIRRLAQVDPARQAVFQKARRGLFERFMERAGSGEIDWTLTLFPTDAYAQDADMDTEAYTDFVLAACKLDQDDPVQAWLDLKEEQQRLIDWLDGRKQVHLTGPEIDLTLSNRRADLDQLGRQAQLPQRRDLHRAGRGLGQRHDPVQLPGGDGGSGDRRHPAAVRERRWSRRRRPRMRRT